MSELIIMSSNKKMIDKNLSSSYEEESSDDKSDKESENKIEGLLDYTDESIHDNY